MPTFEQTKRGYTNLWNKCIVRPSRIKVTDAIIDKGVAHKAQYQAVEKATGVPWWWVMAIHERESSMNFNTHLHNGDSLAGYTHHVPAGRPHLKHGPPFQWFESAIDALTMKGLQKIKPWSIARALYQAEAYNGFGYVGRINSPYVWSFTNLQQLGKYVADGVWSSTALDPQIGVAAIWMRMEAKGLISFKQETKMPPVVFNWHTSLFGLGSILIPILNQIVPILPPPYATIVTGVVAGLGLLFAKDANK